MATTYSYPNSAELRLIEQELMPRLEEGRLGFELMPRVEVDAAHVLWEQRDNYVGLQQIRGLNGAPPSVQRTGSKRYRINPGYYGEFEPIDETDLTERRKLGEFGMPVSIDDLVGEAQVKLMQRELDRVEKIIWDLLTTGTFTVLDPKTGEVHQDTFPLLTASAAVAWATYATATPMVDFRTVQLNGRGQSADYSKAKAYMNQKTANKLLTNKNADDFGGRYRIGGGNTIVSMADVNAILRENGLPEIVVYDRGYLNDSGTFVPFIADDKVAVMAQRPMGQTVGEYQMTRNANNPDLSPGSYYLISDSAETSKKPPRTIEVHRGHNGGPAIWYPGAVTVLTVS